MGWLVGQLEQVMKRILKYTQILHCVNNYPEWLKSHLGLVNTPSTYLLLLLLLFYFRC